jgi:hypothetical protein
MRGADIRFSIGHGRYPYRYPYRPYYRPFPYWGPYAYPPSGYVYPEPRYLDPSYGALDLDIKPENAAVYIDGDYLGVADHYDGFPRYLWLREGTYRLVLHLGGYETMVRDVRVRPGEVIAMRDRMARGEATPPETFAPSEAVTESARVKSESEDRVSPPSPPDRADGGAVAIDQRGDPARLVIDIVPADAAVYLDGRFLGTGADLRRLHSGLLIDAGAHRLEVSRPGYRSHSVDVQAKAGEGVEVTVELEHAP